GGGPGRAGARGGVAPAGTPVGGRRAPPRPGGRLGGHVPWVEATPRPARAHRRRRAVPRRPAGALPRHERLVGAAALCARRFPARVHLSPRGRGGLHAVPGLRGGEGGAGVALRGGPTHPARAFGRAARGPRRAVPRDGPRRALVSGARDAPLALTPGGAFDRLRLAVETARGTPRAVLRGPLMSP